MNIGVVGVTGLVGQMFLKVMEEKNIKADNFRFFASKKSAGKKIKFQNKEYVVEELTEESFDGLDYALFSAGGDVSRKYSPIAAAKGCTVIDNSSAFRMQKDIPLVVPEVNGEETKGYKGIVANPNCSTIQCMLPLKHLRDKYGIKRVVYSSYQAVSGSGNKGVKDMERGIEGGKNEFYCKNIAYNCLPLIGNIKDNGYTDEEMKMIDETRKILSLPELKVTATCVRVPVWNGHGVSVNVELEKEFDLKELKEYLKDKEGIEIEDDIPTPIDVTGQDKVQVGRIRRDESLDNGINFWVVADNIRKGAASNAVQILELMLEERK